MKCFHPYKKICFFGQLCFVFLLVSLCSYNVKVITLLYLRHIYVIFLTVKIFVNVISIYYFEHLYLSILCSRNVEGMPKLCPLGPKSKQQILGVQTHFKDEKFIQP
jgi:hypothetical protein